MPAGCVSENPTRPWPGFEPSLGLRQFVGTVALTTSSCPEIILFDFLNAHTNEGLGLATFYSFSDRYEDVCCISAAGCLLDQPYHRHH